MKLESFLNTTRNHLDILAQRAYSPYSGRRQSCIFLLSNGDSIPGVRVENASYSLSITAFQNAWSTSLGIARTDVVGIVFKEAVGALEGNIIGSVFSNLNQASETLFIDIGIENLPDLEKELSLFVSIDGLSESERMEMCRANASNAVIGESNFPVSCLLELEEGKGILSTNVESAYWPHILCAERNALSTAQSLGLKPGPTLYLSCPQDMQASPCGACRQVIIELAPKAQLLMDRPSNEIERSDPSKLLPGPFLGESLRS